MATYQVRVRRDLIAGIAADGARLNILPGRYTAEHTGRHLTFKGADQRTRGDIVVDLADYLELEDFPDVPPGQQIEVIPD